MSLRLDSPQVAPLVEVALVEVALVGVALMEVALVGVALVEVPHLRFHHQEGV